MIKNSAGEKVYKTDGGLLCVSGWDNNTVRILIHQKETGKIQVFIDEETTNRLYHYLGWLLGRK